MALAQYTDMFWYPSGALAPGIAVRIFPHDSNILAPLFTDATGTVPLANPLTTSPTATISFWAEAGLYWMHADSESFEIGVGLTPDDPDAIEELQAAVLQLQGEMNAVEGEVDTLQIDMNAAEADIDTLQSGLATANGEINALQADMTTAQNDINVLQADVGAVEGDITALEAAMTTAQGQIGTLQSEMNTAQADINAVEADVVAVESDVSTLQGEMTTAQGEINTLQADMTDVESDVTTLQGEMTTAQGEINTLQADMTDVEGDVSTLQGEMTTAQGEINTLQADVTSVEGDVSTLQGEMTTAQGEINTLQADVLALQSDVDDIEDLNAVAMSTGIAAGGDISVSVTPSSIDIAPFTGYFVDVLTDPFNPSVTRVDYLGGTVALDAPALLRTVTYWLMNSSLAIVQQALPPTNTQQRTHIFLGLTFQVAGVITVDQSLPTILQQPANQLADLMTSLGPFNIAGNRVTPNGANLSFNVSAGTLFAQAFNHFVGPTQTNDPHVSTTAAQVPASLRYATQTSTTFGTLRTTLDVVNYDVAGTVTAIGGTSNRSTIHRIFAIPQNTVTEQIVVQYGQTVYTDLPTAVASIGGGLTSYVVNPTLRRTGALIAYVAARRDATDASITTQCQFVTAGRFPTP